MYVSNLERFDRMRDGHHERKDAWHLVESPIEPTHDFGWHVWNGRREVNENVVHIDVKNLPHLVDS
jgi:hypothetical protein